jgi:Bacteriocin-protection, YdeI or OmpD-Associated/Domain of unknown function (DUF1905)
MGIEVPATVVESLGKGKKPPVIVTIGAYSWRSTVASMGGKYLVGIAKEHREPAGLTGDEREVEVRLALDAEPRTVDLPIDLSDALAAEGLMDAFGRLAPSARKEWVRQIETAKSEATRLSRIGKAIEAARARA